MSIHLSHGTFRVGTPPASSTFYSHLFAEFQGGSFDAWGPTAPGTEILLFRCFLTSLTHAICRIRTLQTVDRARFPVCL